MSSTMSSPRQLQYNWQNRFYDGWVGKYAEMLSQLERLIEDDRMFRDVVDTSRLFSNFHVPAQVSDKYAVVAVSYLMLKDRRPWISLSEFEDLPGIDRLELNKAVKQVRLHAYIPELQTPEDFLEAMKPRLSEKELRAGLEVLADFPDEVKEDHLKGSVTGAAMHHGFGLDLDDDTLYRMLGDDIIPENVRNVAAITEDAN